MDVVSTVLSRFGGSQLANAQIIMREFQAATWPVAGVGTALGVAAVVNAYYESGLNSSAVGDGGQSVGLFQINALQGKRQFSGDRRDPVYNTRWIIDETKAHWNRTFTKTNVYGQDYSGPSLGQLAASNGTIPQFTAAFCGFVERPANTKHDAATRAAAASAWIGPVLAHAGWKTFSGALEAAGNFLSPTGKVAGLPTPIWWAAGIFFGSVALLGLRKALRG